MISKHISYREATFSATAERFGIQNKPNAEQIENMRFLAETIFEPLRILGNDKPIHINSFFRSKELNEKIGGSKNSQHCKGQAIDLDNDNFDGLTNFTIFDIIKRNFQFDQLIWEFGDGENPAWVHVSITDGDNRNEILRSFRTNGIVRYERI